MEGLFVILAVLAFAIVIPVTVFMRRQANEAWKQAAAGLGLRFQSPSLFGARKISGSVDGLAVEVDTFTRSSGKSSTTYTRFRVRFPEPLGLGLKLTREGFFSGFAKRLGSQDIELGDAAFDPEVMVKGRDPLAVGRFLTPARRLRVHRFLATYHGAVIDDTEIEWHTRGVFRDPGRIATMVKAMTGLAWHLAQERSSDRRVHRVLEERNAGRPARALEILAAPPEPLTPPPPPELMADERPPQEPALIEVDEDAQITETPPLMESTERPPEEQVLEGELLLLTGREDDAQRAFEAALEQAPDDPEIREWVERPLDAARGGPLDAARGRPLDVARGGPAEGPVSSEVEEPVEEARPEPVEWAVDTVCAALFGDDASSYQVSQRFEQRFRNHPVSWSGMLLEVESYSFDAVFGSDSGTRAVVVVFDTGSGVFGESKVYAVVQLPPEATAALAERRGDTIGFRGRLAKVDTMMRNLYVAEGALEDDG